MTKQQRLPSRNSTPLLLVALLALAPTPSGAFVLGEPVPLSRIGEPLRIEIPVVQGDPAQVAECLRPAAPSAPSDGLPRVRNARIDIIGRPPNVRLVLSHRLPSFDPALRFAVEDLCDSRLRREYTVLLTFPEESAAATESAGALAPARSGGTLAEAPAQEAPRRARTSRRATPASDVAATAPTASSAPSRAAAPSAKGSDRLELGGGESEVAGAGLRLSTQLGSLARIDATSEAQREQLRREQSVIMAIDRTIVTQLELNERIRQLEAVQARLMAEHIRTPASDP
ncbi:type IV pilus assembly protein FimV, partial [Aromatoleum petrolei]|nr:hypothetical protein [Aromatoleum petrolei]